MRSAEIVGEHGWLQCTAMRGNMPIVKGILIMVATGIRLGMIDQDWRQGRSDVLCGHWRRRILLVAFMKGR